MIQKNKKTKTKRTLVNKLDRVFSLYIRLRDIMPNGYGRCISCGRIKSFSELDCGHFFSRAKMATRFSEHNCNAECRYCNRMSSDHLVGYQENLKTKIGERAFSALVVQSSMSKKWEDFELEQLIKHYTAEVKRLSLMRGVSVKV